MARAWRIEFEGALYHVFSRGNERRDIFFGDDDRRLFLETLGEMANRFEIEPCAYVLMNNHYQGYVLRVDGTCGNQTGEFQIAIGKAAHEKHQFRTGMEVSGLAAPVPDPRFETAGFYKTSRLKVLKDAEGEPSADPPFHGVPPDLETYRGRGHRRLDIRTYESRCSTCIWGCRMPVEMIIDHWNPSRKSIRLSSLDAARTLGVQQPPSGNGAMSNELGSELGNGIYVAQKIHILRAN